MLRWVLFLAALAAFAGDEPKKPDYMKRKPVKAEKKTGDAAPSLPSVSQESAVGEKPAVNEKPAVSEMPSVSEMKVERSSSGNAVSAGKPVTKKEPAVHGEVRGTGTQFGKQGSGTAVVKDKKDGKWAITASGEKTRVQ